MDKLPQEVIDRLARHLFPVLFTAWDNIATLNARQQEATWRQHDSLSAAAYATISLSWQRAIEKKIFTLVKIRSPSDELKLRQIMARNPHRRDSVRYIKCNINLDCLDRATHTLFPVVSDRGVISKIGSILRLVNLIRPSSLASSMAKAPLFLQISIVNLRPLLGAERGNWGASSDINNLPTCPGVTHLQITHDEDINLRLTRPRKHVFLEPTEVPPVWMSDILTKFPTVDDVVWELLEFLDEGQQRTKHRTGEREEPLNVAIRTLSQQLVSLQIIGIFTVTPDLFINRKAQAAPGIEQQQPYWSRLENLHIETTNWTYNGTWYINPNMLRVVWRINDFLRSSTPDFNNLMVAMSHGMLNMPKLQKLDISFRFPPFNTGKPIDKRRFKDLNGDDSTSLLFHVIRYRRASSEWLELADCKAAKELYCNLDLFDSERLYSRLGQEFGKFHLLPVYWRPFPEQAVRNWNILHRRIKGVIPLLEWRSEDAHPEPCEVEPRGGIWPYAERERRRRGSGVP
ncbi:hypothetical protein NCU08534 [Neurospora crassa OR74A]|uniref:Uncharacterized protein n=1 Tax=Neurospora crassa (strain ATCC 24698 / 74-OR23-1A / CBS 708.71 / DSM 1257 / FGSC 987) TaxID=367110 RepID=Q7SBL6_NEUCR|nr:hypothetical protein NCU08534 [Neurospora crassa OR74A]EAA33780.1 hypothetical protein NCU08534 [Neurospora crassa OR74A]|eukprot:XP_963016.1 hypothetical protein NCU08534 [Neurospora crassa OR74A]